MEGGAFQGTQTSQALREKEGLGSSVIGRKGIYLERLEGLSFGFSCCFKKKQATKEKKKKGKEANRIDCLGLQSVFSAQPHRLPASRPSARAIRGWSQQIGTLPVI